MSSSKFTYTSVDRLLAKLNRDIGLSGLSEGDIIEWIGEALEGIGAVQAYEEAVAVIEVRNHQCDLPSNFHAIVQVANNTCWNQADMLGTGLCATNLVEANPLDTPSAHCPVVLDCSGQPLQEYELAYYRPYFDLKYEYGAWMGNSIYRGCFAPVRLSTNTFSSLVCKPAHGQEYAQLMSSCQHEYTIIAGKTLRFNFCDGQVALSYLRQQLDEETGYPMIPDDFSYLNAITAYVTMKVFAKQYYAGREGAKNKMDKAEEQWQWYCGQSANKAKMPKSIDEHQNILEQSKYLIPRLGEYYGFFGRLNKAEYRGFNNPDGRNKTFH